MMMKLLSNNKLMAHRVLWDLVPADAQHIALMKQTAALAIRLCERNGMTELQAIAWVIDLKHLSQREFKNTSVGYFDNGDTLQLWEFKAIVALNLQDDFITKRYLQQWKAAEEPWLFDERWNYPLHLVDSAVMAGFGRTICLNP